ncbi:MAG TPA: RiPP maturation radical SAM C-methyltransferase [Kineosporiaceae bacterium]|nr:RiPP maturation radical SAM C-methyltransferase [Kineosporiaceae bacterium]
MAPSSISKERVLLVSMPFGAIERPSLALGLLGAHCARDGVACETRYLTVSFAEAIGLADYTWVCNELPYTAFAGEWVFAEALYGPRVAEDRQYLDGVLRDIWQLTPVDVVRLRRIREQVEPFLDSCVRELAGAGHTFIGFTSVFHQNVPSLALARRLKQAQSDVTIAFGGANWEEEMGQALLDQFDFVDLAFSGEADRSFPAVLAARRDGRLVTDVPGVMHSGTSHASATTVQDLDEVPEPDYEPYYQQLRASPVTADVTPTLLVETSRGCWWGARSHCTFCGLNGATMAFRSKSTERVLAEFATLRERYGDRTFSVVDDIIDSRYFHSVLPALAAAQLDVELFWEVKANLSRTQVQTLGAAGVKFIQPGIESLSDHVLTLMRKGTTGLRNIELLKWCKEYGVAPMWNLLYGFPGETEDDYLETVQLIQAIWHLDPPTGYGPVRLDRFSPYHADPAMFGMTNIRPMAPFLNLYPFDDETVNRIAYYFDFDYADGRHDDVHARPAVDLALLWMRDGDRGELTVTPDGDAIRILDTRRGLAAPRRATLRDWKAEVFEKCDRSQRIDTLLALPLVRSQRVDLAELGHFLERCARYQLMALSGGRWLSLAVHHPARVGVPDDSAAGLTLTPVR